MTPWPAAAERSAPRSSASAAAGPSPEAMAKLVEMGMEEGMTLAMGQIDRILSEG